MPKNGTLALAVMTGTLSALLLGPVASAARTLPDVSHEVVCSCKCNTENQTFAWEGRGDDCTQYNGIDCASGGHEYQLSGCEPKAVEKDVIVEPDSTPAQTLQGLGSDQPRLDLDLTRR